jgi:hypothetical protein
MNEARAHRLAVLQSPQIIVHNTGPDGSLRGACASMGKPAITIEIGDPQVINPALTEKALVGIRNTLAHLKMLPLPLALDETTPVVCSRSFWMTLAGARAANFSSPSFAFLAAIKPASFSFSFESLAISAPTSMRSARSTKAACSALR